MAAGSEAHARDAELAALSGEKLVDLLRTTCRRSDFEAVARVLKARDRRYAEVKAALSDINALREKYDALLDSRRRSRDEAEEVAPLIGISSSRYPVHRDEPRVEELEDVVPSRPLKRLKQCETSALESGKRDGHGQSNSVDTLVNCGQKSSSAKSVHSAGPEDVPPSRPLERLRQCGTSALKSGKRDEQGQRNSVGTLGNFGQKSSSAKSVHSVGSKGRIGQPVASSTSKDSKQGRGAVEPEKWGGAGEAGEGTGTGTVPLLSPGRSVLPKGSSERDQGRARTGNKQSSSDGILGSPPKWNGKTIKTSMVESSGAVEPEKWGGGMTRTVPLLSPGRSVLPKGSSERDHGKVRTGKKQSSSDGVLGPPPKWNGKTIKTSMVESSTRSANKDTGTAMSLYRQTEDAKGGNPVQETIMVAAPSLNIPTLTGQELRAYCLKPERTPPASCMEIKTQNFRDSAKGGNGLSMKPVDVPSKEKLVGGTEEHPKTW